MFVFYPRLLYFLIYTLPLKPNTFVIVAMILLLDPTDLLHKKREELYLFTKYIDNFCKLILEPNLTVVDMAVYLVNFPTPLDDDDALSYLKRVTDYVFEHRHERVYLPEATTTVIVGTLQDTEYRDKADEVRACSQLYLPTTQVEMEVVGYALNTPYYCDQLILLVREDGKFYGYDGDELHLLPDRWRETGSLYPPSKSYYHGEAFEDATVDFLDKVRASPRVRKAEEEYHAIVASQATEITDILNRSRAKRRRLAKTLLEIIVYKKRQCSSLVILNI